MKATTILGSLAAAFSVTAYPSSPTDDLVEPTTLVDLIESAKSQVISNLLDKESDLLKRGQTPGCTVNKLVFRRE